MIEFTFAHLSRTNFHGPSYTGRYEVLPLRLGWSIAVKPSCTTSLMFLLLWIVMKFQGAGFDLVVPGTSVRIELPVISRAADVKTLWVEWVCNFDALGEYKRWPTSSVKRLQSVSQDRRPGRTAIKLLKFSKYQDRNVRTLLKVLKYYKIDEWPLEKLTLQHPQCIGEKQPPPPPFFIIVNMSWSLCEQNQWINVRLVILALWSVLVERG